MADRAACLHRHRRFDQIVDHAQMGEEIEFETPYQYTVESDESSAFARWSSGAAAVDDQAVDFDGAG
jgi:hypothetical protein